MKKSIIGLLILFSSLSLESNAQWESIYRTDPPLVYYTPLDTMMGAGHIGRGCLFTYVITYGLADTVFTTIQIPGDTTSYCTLFAIRHPYWVGSFIN